MEKRFCLFLLILVTAMVIMLPVLVCAWPVPDTGQVKCYDNTQEIPCPQLGQPFYGQDAQYGPNLQSFSELGNGIVRDNVTGLEWQQETAPGTYTWQQAVDYSNNLSLGGKDDWRLPTVKELSALVDSSIFYPGPTINTSYFPDTVGGTVESYYWSTPSYVDRTSDAWFVLFYDGAVYFYGKSLGYYVRAVRGGQSNNSFVDNGDGTISDTSSGLMWQKATAPGTYTWEQALTYCENLTLAGYTDWRLPNRNELQSIVDYNRFDPAIDTTYFPDTIASYYWASTTDVGHGTNYAWYVIFSGGYVNGYVKSGNYSVRAVRDVGSTGTSTISSTSTTVCDDACWQALYEQSQSQLQQCQTELQICQNQTTTTTAQPTNISLSSLKAIPSDTKVNLKWKTETETETAGFNIWRAEGFKKVNNAVIPALGSPTAGLEYDFVDEWVLNGKRYFYLLEDIDTNGISTFHGPAKAVPRWWKGVGN